MDAPLRITVDLEAGTPVYRQISDQLRHLLVTGRLAAGSEIPSVRRLAIDLGVHHNTVAEAYRRLADEGWLGISQGRAVRVLTRQMTAPARTEVRRLRDRFHRRLQHLVAEMRSSGIPDDWIDAELRAAQRPESGRG